MTEGRGRGLGAALSSLEDVGLGWGCIFGPGEVEKLKCQFEKGPQFESRGMNELCLLALCSVGAKTLTSIPKRRLVETKIDGGMGHNGLEEAGGSQTRSSSRSCLPCDPP